MKVLINSFRFFSFNFTWKNFVWVSQNINQSICQTSHSQSHMARAPTEHALPPNNPTFFVLQTFSQAMEVASWWNWQQITEMALYGFVLWLQVLTSNLQCGLIKKKLIELSGTFHAIHVWAGLAANHPIDSFHLDKYGIALSTTVESTLLDGHPWWAMIRPSNYRLYIQRNATYPTKPVRSGLTFSMLLEENSACGARTTKQHPQPV